MRRSLHAALRSAAVHRKTVSKLDGRLHGSFEDCGVALDNAPRDPLDALSLLEHEDASAKDDEAVNSSTVTHIFPNRFANDRIFYLNVRINLNETNINQQNAGYKNLFRNVSLKSLQLLFIEYLFATRVIRKITFVRTF